MDSRLNSFIQELDGIDLVLNKLESKTNVNVFEKLCGNCERVFEDFCELSAVELVKAGLASKAIEFLERLKSQVIRLKNYKEAITEYIKMTSGDEITVDAPSTQEISNKASELSNTVKPQENNDIGFGSSNITDQPSVPTPDDKVISLEEAKKRQLAPNVEGSIAA